MGNAAKPCLRNDLIHRRIRMGRQWMWVVKDPISRVLYHFDEHEHSLLCKVDGTRTIRDLIESARTIYPSQIVAPEPIVTFIADANQKSLLAGGFPRPSAEINSPTKLNWLSIRFPGVDPTSLLNRFSKPIAWVTSPIAIATMAGWWICGAIIAVTRGGDLMRDLATAAGRIENAWVLLVAIAAMKIVHELGHAIACRRLGARCGEIGVLLLFGVPCLYADVSDAWMIAKPWKRILVSAAGMIAELTVAAIAAIVWTFTIDGTVRDVCVGLMVVGSVSTIVFNGNPLLRYDGYYILSDVVGIPNLAARSRSMLRHAFGSNDTPDASPATKTGLIAYAIASTAYRWFVVALIVSVLFAAASSAGLAGLFVMVFAVVAAVGIIRRLTLWAKNRGRSWVTAAVSLAAIIALIFTPLPRSISGPAMIVPADPTDIVVSRAGVVQVVRLAASTLHAGEPIVQLHNEDLSQTRMRLQTRLDRLSASLRSTRNRRSTHDDASNQIPTLVQSIAETQGQLDLIDDELAETTIHATADGKWFPESRSSEPVNDDRQHQFYSGNPIAPANIGAYLEPGTKLGTIASPSERRGTVYLDQSDIVDVRIGDAVTLRMADRPRGTVTGRVIEVSASPIDPPSPLLQSGRIRPTEIDGQSAPFYAVQIQLAPTNPPPPVQAMVTAQVRIAPMSIWQRTKKFAGNSF